MSAAESDVPAEVLELVRDAGRITVLTGAGMSAESGVPTFRDAQTGLWSSFDPMSLATPEAFEDDPALVHAWYLWRVRLVREVEPNAGHRALARLGDDRDVRIFTQNVDDLHERAGTPATHLHGSLFAFRCSACGAPYPVPADVPHDLPQRLEPPACDTCGAPVRPGTVWFGEALPAEAFAAAERACADADVLLSVGTSGIVYPAAGLPGVARGAGVPVVEVNPAQTPVSDLADHRWRTTAATGLPALVAGVVA